MIWGLKSGVCTLVSETLLEGIFTPHPKSHSLCSGLCHSSSSSHCPRFSISSFIFYFLEQEKEVPGGGGGRRERLLSWLHTQCSAWRGARSTTLRPWPEPTRAVGCSTDWASQASPVVLSFIKHVWVANCESLHVGKCLCFVLPCDWRVFWEFWLQPLFPTERGHPCSVVCGAKSSSGAHGQSPASSCGVLLSGSKEIPLCVDLYSFTHVCLVSIHCFRLSVGSSGLWA